MLTGLNIKRGQAEGRYDEMLDVIEILAQRFGSVPNAARMIAEESPVYREGLELLAKARAAEAAQAASKKAG